MNCLRGMKQNRWLAFSSKFTNLSSWKTCKISYRYIGLSDQVEMIMRGTGGSGMCLFRHLPVAFLGIFKNGTVSDIIDLLMPRYSGTFAPSHLKSIV